MRIGRKYSQPHVLLCEMCAAFPARGLDDTVIVDHSLSTSVASLIGARSPRERSLRTAYEVTVDGIHRCSRWIGITLTLRNPRQSLFDQQLVDLESTRG